MRAVLRLAGKHTGGADSVGNSVTRACSQYDPYP